ncbi:MAG: nitroreductase family protein [Actinomycetaceae bacterium]|nr:nitroreductase family protein [Actinomycetaceae bacterium]
MTAIFEHSHSQRHFSDAYVDKQLIIDAWDQAKFAPTAFNCQPMRIDLVGQGPTRKALVPLAGISNQDAISSAPWVCVLSWDPDLSTVMTKCKAPQDFIDMAQSRVDTVSPQSATLQAAYFLVTLRARGLGVAPMTGLSINAVDKLLHRENHWRTMMVFCIGYPDFTQRNPTRAPRPSWGDIAQEYDTDSLSPTDFVC